VLAQHGAVGGAPSIVSAYARWCKQYHIDANIALAQACQETGYFTSERWVQENNPAGLGITADNTPPNPFSTDEEGIRAHIEHLCCYAYQLYACPVDHANMADRRHFFHVEHNSIAGLEAGPKWAVPGTAYVAAICRIANDVTGGAAPPQNGGEMAVPYDRIHLAADVGPQRAMSDIQWFVVHDTEGHFAGDEAVLTSAAPPVESAHFILGKQEGQCVYSVPLDYTAWTPGNDAVAVASVNVEMSGFADGREGGYSDYQYRKIAEIFDWCVSKGMTNVPAVYIGRVDGDGGPLPDIPGIIGHMDVPDGNGGWGGSSHHTDPGPTWDFSRMVAGIGGAAPPSDVRTFPETGKSITGSFKGHWEQFGDDAKSIDFFGYPIWDTEPGMCEDGVTRTVQWFERARFEDYGGGDVHRSRLGAMALRKLGRHGPGID
jgi:N-acetyl-anhydromuramyl-L-alanine amidase AmpD